MAILVDNAAVLWRGKSWYHMGSDDPTPEGIAALHEFAESIGCKRSWFQPHRIVDHYDVTDSYKARAIAAGAESVTTREYLTRCRKDKRPTEQSGNT
jgi:hypothetical protein